MKLAPEIMKEVFDILECSYPLRNEFMFKPQNIGTAKYGIKAAVFAGSKIWSYMPSELKESTSLNKFRSKIKTSKAKKCPGKLCKIFLQRVGESVICKILISICSQMLLYMILYLFVCLFYCFFCLFLFLFYFLLFSPFSLKSQF